MAQIIPAGYCSGSIRITGPFWTDGYALATLATANPAGGNPSDAAVAVADALLATDIDSALAQGARIDLVEMHTDTASGLASVNITGGRSGAQAPPNVALNVRKRTIVRGPHGRGRFLFPGLLGDADIDDSGGISTGTRDSLQNVFDDFLGALSANDAPMVLLGSDQSRTPPPEVPPTVTALLVDSLISTCRRRLRR